MQALASVESSWSDDEIEQYARSAAAFLGLEIQEDDWRSVLANMQALRAVASVLLERPFPDDIAGGPVFSA